MKKALLILLTVVGVSQINAEHLEADLEDVGHSIEADFEKGLEEAKKAAKYVEREAESAYNDVEEDI